MKILSLELQGYKRLSLNRINYIKITPESKIQLILGTNGSGKSSLLKELTPLPAIPGEYHRGGFKVIEISHRNSHYVLKSIFGKDGKNKFHFIKDGEDLLGDGGTSSVYRDLVKQHFGITPDIHKLLIGLLKFTEMDTAKRRNWLTMFSDVDYTYAFKYYQRLKDQHRDLTGAIKLQQARLVQESEKLLKPEEEAKYRQDIKVLNETLVHFLEMKTPSSQDRHTLMEQIKQIDLELQISMSLTIRSYTRFMRENTGFTSAQALDAECISIQANIQASQVLIDNLCEVIEGQHKTLDALRSSNIQSAGELDKAIDKLLNDIATEKGQLQIQDFEYTNPQGMLQSLNSVQAEVIDVFTQLENNENRIYTRELYLKALDDDKALTFQISELEKRQADNIAKRKELEHLQTHDKVECPKCDHVWFRGYDEAAHRRLLEEIENTSKLHQNASQALKKVHEYTEKAKAYMELYRSYITITRASPNLEVFWKYLSDSSLIFDNPRQAVTKLETFKNDLIQAVKIEDLKQKLQESLDLKMLLSRNQEVNFVKLQEESEKSDKELYRLNQTLRANKERLEAVKRLKSWLETFESNMRLMQESLESRDQQASKLFEIFRREALNTCIQATQKELAVREQAISRIDIQKALVANINEQIVEMAEKAEVLKMALRALSPSEGLIAQGLTGFINHFVAQVNSFIKKVWLYPMELVPISIDADDTLDLDYNFQVRINEDMVNDPIPDIADTSSGMKEIIDLAFRIVSMQYLGLSEFPIYLDEFGARLDAAHRDSVHYAITNLLTSADFSQIYMISHYEQSYGSLANTDVAVLCEQNIGLSKGTVFNKHVEMR